MSGFRCQFCIGSLTKVHYPKLYNMAHLLAFNVLLLPKDLTINFIQRYAQIDGTEPPKGYPIMRLGIIDSHFHLDRLPTHNLIRSSGGLKNMMTKSVNLIYGIANYVYTDSWNKMDRQTQSPKVKYTIGIHPHRIMPNLALSLFNKLKNKLAQNPEAVGIGEVGLDGITDCRCAVNHNLVNCISRKREEQHRFLELVFRFAKQHEDKVLVIHARDDEEGTYKAASKIYDLIKRCDLCNARIHRHCFVGKENEFRDWRDTFQIAISVYRINRSVK